MKKFLLIAVAVLALASPLFAQTDPVTDMGGSLTNYPYFDSGVGTAVTVTNGSVLPIVASKYEITATAATAGTTNVITISQPYRKGGLCLLHVSSASTVKVAIASCAWLPMGWRWIGASNDVLVIDVQKTNYAVRIADSSFPTATVAVVQGLLDSGPTAAGAFYITGASTSLTHKANTLTGAAMVGGTAAIAGASTSLTSVVNLQTVNDWLNVGGSATGATLAATAYWTGIMTNQIQGVGTQKTTIVFGQVKTNVWVGL